MKVRELIEELKKLPQDAEVIMSQDGEGNGHSPCYGIGQGTVPTEEVGNYHIESFYSDEHTDDECCLEPGERENFAKVVCLWPMN